MKKIIVCFVLLMISLSSFGRIMCKGYFRSYLDEKYVLDCDNRNQRTWDGATVQVWEFLGLGTQQWLLDFEDNYFIIRSSVNPDLCVSLGDGNLFDRKNVILTKYRGLSHQKWQVKYNIMNYYLSYCSLADGKYVIDVENAVDVRNIHNGSNVIIWPFAQTHNQIWHFQEIESYE